MSVNTNFNLASSQALKEEKRTEAALETAQVNRSTLTELQKSSKVADRTERLDVLPQLALPSISLEALVPSIDQALVTLSKQMPPGPTPKETLEAQNRLSLFSRSLNEVGNATAVLVAVLNQLRQTENNTNREIAQFETNQAQQQLQVAGKLATYQAAVDAGTSVQGAAAGQTAYNNSYNTNYPAIQGQLQGAFATFNSQVQTMQNSFQNSASGLNSSYCACGFYGNAIGVPNICNPWIEESFKATPDDASPFSPDNPLYAQHLPITHTSTTEGSGATLTGTVTMTINLPDGEPKTIAATISLENNNGTYGVNVAYSPGFAPGAANENALINTMANEAAVSIANKAKANAITKDAAGASIAKEDLHVLLARLSSTNPQVYSILQDVQKGMKNLMHQLASVVAGGSGNAIASYTATLVTLQKETQNLNLSLGEASIRSSDVNVNAGYATETAETTIADLASKITSLQGSLSKLQTASKDLTYASLATGIGAIIAGIVGVFTGGLADIIAAALGIASGATGVTAGALQVDIGVKEKKIADDLGEQSHLQKEVASFSGIAQVSNQLTGNLSSSLKDLAQNTKSILQALTELLKTTGASSAME